MESPRKFNDCYFYYYSTCTKGDNCVFRHEPSALGCETMCSAWQQGKCLDKRCKLRHMELRKNRKQIPCYWENQPGGCRKKHCPFMHKNPDARTDGIAPSQPAPLQPQVSAAGMGVPLGEGVGPAVGGVEPLPPPPGVPPPAPAPVPMLWQHQQQRQVVLDSAILGVLPAPSELLGARRVVGGVGNVGGVGGVEPNPYAPLPVDPLVVNFEEESDNESAPSVTPTKQDPDDKSQELLLLEKIQAEAAAYYSYDLPAPPAATAPPAPLDSDRKLVRTNLSVKYDRLSLDDLAGNKHPPATERRKSLDFKVLSLEEIRARKKAEIVQSTPITLNLSRKRKSSTHETVTSSGNKIIKVVRSNSIVYKKLDPNASTNTAESSKAGQKQTESVESRKRTLSEVSDAYEIQADELVDNCYEFKRIKVTESTSKPRLIRNRIVSLDKASTETNSDRPEVSNNEDDDSDSEVQIVSVVEKVHVDLSDCDVIDVDSAKIGEHIDIVDLSDDDDVTVSGSDLAKNVPDVVASCQKKVDIGEKNLLIGIETVLCDDDTLKNIDSILDEDSINTIEDDL